jgi:hypothetical protein
MDNRFDRWAKVVAGSTSRREALSRMGGGLLAVFLAPLGYRKAWADNSACAHFCDAIYPPGPLRGQCKSQGAMDQGICQNICSGNSCVSASGGFCPCFMAAEGVGVCGITPMCDFAQDCTSTSDCPFGQICAVNTICTLPGQVGGVCALLCI